MSGRSPGGDSRASSLRGTREYRLAIPTRWHDNDVYGHVNNVEYYAFFDTVINEYLIREGGLDIHGGAVIGLCAESHCEFKAPLAFPETLTAGLRVGHLGSSSVRYEIALYGEGGDDRPAGLQCRFDQIGHAALVSNDIAALGERRVAVKPLEHADICRDLVSPSRIDRGALKGNVRHARSEQSVEVGRPGNARRLDESDAAFLGKN